MTVEVKASCTLGDRSEGQEPLEPVLPHKLEKETGVGEAGITDHIGHHPADLDLIWQVTIGSRRFTDC